jgi:hypothetical protein
LRSVANQIRGRRPSRQRVVRDHGQSLKLASELFGVVPRNRGLLTNEEDEVVAHAASLGERAKR